MASRDSIKLSTFDELFTQEKAPVAKAGLRVPDANKLDPNSPPKHVRKFKSFKRKSVAPNELFGILSQQRVLVDENAIHFVAEAREGPRADARNSVFKLAQRYKVLPDREHVLKIKQMYGKVKEEDSGDEAWDKADARLPGKLDSKAYLRLIHKEETQQCLLDEAEQIETETQNMSGTVVSHDVVDEGTCQSGMDVVTDQPVDENQAESGDDSMDEEQFDDEDLKTLNSMQREFIGNNLLAWFKDIQAAYVTGVKMVKINAFGYKFIRIVMIADMVRRGEHTCEVLCPWSAPISQSASNTELPLPSEDSPHASTFCAVDDRHNGIPISGRGLRELFTQFDLIVQVLSIRQPHTKSQAKLDRQVAIHDLAGVHLGKGSKEFRKVEELISEGKESSEFK